MAETSDLIIDTSEIAEDEFGSGSEPADVQSDIAATKDATGDRMEFYVQMRGYTQSDMDDLIVEAAARQLVGKHNDRALSKKIEERCIALITAKADTALERVTTEIIDQPLTPAFGDKKPVTMREFIGLTGREYLTERVDRDGKRSENVGWGRDHTFTRVELLVIQHVNKTFKSEIEKATNSAIMEIQNAIRAKLNAVLADEKARVHAAIEKASA